jgi:hypothetical protein
MSTDLFGDPLPEPRRNLKWPAIIAAAADIVGSYDTMVTLRQLFYRLIAATLIPNTNSAYKQLSALTAEGRRDGDFPDLIDNTRAIAEWYWYRDPAEALTQLAAAYRRNRTENQDASIFLATEKRGLVAQLDQWFSDPFGIPVLPLGGWSSQAFIDNDIKPRVTQARREHGAATVLLYAGDFDASGDRIDRVFAERTPECWDHIERVALNPEQVDRYRLTRQRGKHKDPNVAAFVARHGAAAIYDPADPYIVENGKRYVVPVQVEMEALDPNDLRALFTDAIRPFWDTSRYEAVLAQEAAEREDLTTLARSWEP